MLMLSRCSVKSVRRVGQTETLPSRWDKTLHLFPELLSCGKFNRPETPHDSVSETISFRAKVFDQPADQPVGWQWPRWAVQSQIKPHCWLVVVGIAASPTFMLIDEINTSDAADLNSFSKTVAE